MLRQAWCLRTLYPGVCAYVCGVTVSNDSAVLYGRLITLFWHKGQIYKSVFMGSLNHELPQQSLQFAEGHLADSPL